MIEPDNTEPPSRASAFYLGAHREQHGDDAGAAAAYQIAIAANDPPVDPAGSPSPGQNAPQPG